MCGIVGIIRKTRNGLNKTEIDMFKQLLFADQLRGTDGTGIFFNSVNTKTENIISFKSSENASYLLNLPEFVKDIEPILFKQSDFVVGHNRAASIGDKSLECTHPFQEGDIVLVHNGTLSNHTSLNASSKVDSHAICHNINKEGAESTIKKLTGSFALVWVNKKENTLNLCRNIQRPLHLIETDFNYIISSEKDLGKWIINRNGGKITNEILIDPYTIYSFNVGKGMQEYKKEKITQHTETYNQWGGYLGNHIRPAYSPNGLFYKALYKLGDFVRFKTGKVIKSVKNRFFILGDINQYPSQSSNYITRSDFKEEWLIKIFGAKLNLEVFAEQDDVIGEVVQVINNKGHITYVVARPEKYDDTKIYGKKKKKNNVLALPDKLKEEKTVTNGFHHIVGECCVCQEKLTPGELGNGTNICNSCQEVMMWN